MPKKIFELAKDLDIGAIDLVEKLKANGFSVRNHMNSLTDDEVEKALALFDAKSEVTKSLEPEKKVKKKAKKKATGDGATKKTTKKTITRKKKVIRKKVGKGAEEEVEEATEDETIEVAPQAAEEFIDETVDETDESEEQSSGLRIVSRPVEEQAPIVEEVVEDSTPVEASEDEKPHRFTPVYIPPSTTDEEEPSEDSDDDDKKNKSKKRMGGLATMMSGKKPVVSRAEAINQTRADSELKSYAALSGVGRPLYTQVKKKRSYAGPSKQTEITEMRDAKRVVKLHEGATAEQLAKKLKVKLKDMVDQALDLNLLIRAGDYIGIGLATRIAALYEYRVEDVAFDEDKLLGGDSVDGVDLPSRDPIITIMGHVDHGKTTLLDYIRKAKVAAGEAGGITQHIGAYSVKVRNQQLTFLDTPGHEAFASMRQRGADVTDIVILVVAADDGVMPQTKESIRFCQQANKPIIVAVNKMDKEGANPDRIKQALTEFNLTPEDWGGDTIFCPISALTGAGVDELLESIALSAEMMELKADTAGLAHGVVIESKIEQGRGPVATVLVQSGTLKKGDSIVVGETFGRARSLTNHLGETLAEAGPSTPVQILGLNEAPAPGDSLDSVKNEREAKKVSENRINERKRLDSVQVIKPVMSLEDFFSSASSVGESETKELCLVVRTDVQGSYEAIRQSLEALSNSEVRVKIVGGGVGPISDSDVNLASSARAYILGFNMRPVNTARRIAENHGVEIRTYSIIYELIDDIKKAMEGLLNPDRVEEFIGRAEVRDTFTVPKVGTIAGSYVIDGKIQTGCSVRLLRDGKIVFDGKMSSLKRFKDDVKEVKNGFECGVGLENFNDIKVGDVFEAYIMVEKKRSLDDVARDEKKRSESENESAAL